MRVNTVPEEGWFRQPEYSALLNNKIYVVSTLAQNIYNFKSSRIKTVNCRPRLTILDSRIYFRRGGGGGSFFFLNDQRLSTAHNKQYARLNQNGIVKWSRKGLNVPRCTSGEQTNAWLREGG